MGPKLSEAGTNQARAPDSRNTGLSTGRIIADLRFELHHGSIPVLLRPDHLCWLEIYCKFARTDSCPKTPVLQAPKQKYKTFSLLYRFESKQR